MPESYEKYLYKPIIPSESAINIWMVFPGSEEFAMSSLGHLWLFKNLDECDYVNVERVYSDSVSVKISPDKLDLIGFSFSFDTDFINVFNILDRYKIPLRKCNRAENYPLIYSGGPVITANPAPYEAFFDFFVIGDGEVVNGKIVEVYKNNREKSKSELLQLLLEIKGVYVPGMSKKVKKITHKLSECIYTPIISEKAFFPNTFIVEVSRGCANRCGFCLASYSNLPFRSVPYEKIVETIDLGLSYTNKIALLGAQLSAHPRFEDICEYIYQKAISGQKIEMSVSSLRVDSITPNILKTLVACGQKNITLAIEAGSERLRRVINKNLTNAQIFEAAESAKMAGLRGFKFYGMIGIPTETQEDIEEMINLARELKQKYKGFDISFGFSTFVPKPNTPFQWCGREDNKTLERKSEYIKKEMHKIGIQVKFSSVKWDYWQAVLSRGDNSFGDFLEEVWKDGGSLGSYKKAAKMWNVDADNYACESWSFDKELPWDIIDITPNKDFLINENRRLLNNK